MGSERRAYEEMVYSCPGPVRHRRRESGASRRGGGSDALLPLLQIGRVAEGEVTIFVASPFAGLAHQPGGVRAGAVPL